MPDAAAVAGCGSSDRMRPDNWKQNPDTVWGCSQQFLLSPYLRAHPTLSRYAFELQAAYAEVAKLTLTYLQLQVFTMGLSKTETDFQTKTERHPMYTYAIANYAAFIKLV